MKNQIITNQIKEFLSVTRLNSQVFKVNLEKWEVDFYYKQMLSYGIDSKEIKKYLEYYNKRNSLRID